VFSVPCSHQTTNKEQQPTFFFTTFALIQKLIIMQKRLLIIIGLIIPIGIFSQNLKKALKNLDDGKYTEARVVFNQAKDQAGMRSAAFFGLAKITATDGQPGYDLFKAYEQIKNAKKSFPQMDAKTLGKIEDYFSEAKLNAEDKKIDDALFEYLKVKKNEDLVRRYLNECKESIHYSEATNYLSQLAFTKAKSFDTEIAYREFIENYPKATEVAQAKSRINELAWEKAQKENTPESFTLFIDEYSDAPQLDSAKQALMQLEYDRAISRNTDAAYLSFIKKYPDSEKAIDLQQKREDLAYNKAMRFKVLNVYQKFIDDFPQSKYAPEIINHRDSLAFLAARKTNTDKAYISFVNNYPNAKQVPLAMDLLGNLSFSKAELARMKAKSRIKENKLRSMNAFRVENLDTLIEISIEYDEFGNTLLEIHQPEKTLVNRTEQSFDDKGELMLTRKVLINSKLQKESSFTYFKEGLVKTETVKCYFDCGKYPSEYISKYYYDDKRNLIRQIDSSTVNSNIIAEHKYQYNAQGLMVLEDVNYMDTTNVSTTFRYDAAEQLMEKSTANQDGKILEVISFTYDAQGRKISKKKFNAIGTIDHKFTYNENGLVDMDEVQINSGNEKIILIYRYEFY
jgi:TolA-binding protein